MTDKEIVRAVLSETFAIDGTLTQLHDVHLKPYDKYKLKQNVKKQLKENYGINYSEEELEIKPEKEFFNELVNLIKQHG